MERICSKEDSLQKKKKKKKKMENGVDPENPACYEPSYLDLFAKIYVLVKRSEPSDWRPGGRGFNPSATFFCGD